MVKYIRWIESCADPTDVRYLQKPTEHILKVFVENFDVPYSSYEQVDIVHDAMRMIKEIYIAHESWASQVKPSVS